MKLVAAVFIAQIFLLIAGNKGAQENKRVGCWYLAVIRDEDSPLYPENIDTSLCSHLLYQHGGVLGETKYIRFRLNLEKNYPMRLGKIKEKKPDFKIFVLLEPYMMGRFMNRTAREESLNEGIEWLKEINFDGLNFPLTLSNPNLERIADTLCFLKSELGKHGLMLTSVITDDLSGKSVPSQEKIDSIRKLAGCVDHITLVTTIDEGRADRGASLKKTKAAVDMFTGMGFPPDKIQITGVWYPLIYTLQDPNETGIGANVSGPGTDDVEFGDGYTSTYRNLQTIFNDSSLGWTFSRDNETMEPYAFSNSGMWISYEDTISAEFKARYVLERGLGGIDVSVMEFETTDSTGGGGSFPRTRAISNVLRQEFHSPINSE